MYDKRIALAAKGKMGVVRRYPHAESFLSDDCKYNVLTGFLHRSRRNEMRVGSWRAGAVSFILDMHDARKRDMRERVHEPCVNY